MAQRVLSDTINVEFVKNISLFSGLSKIEKDVLLTCGSIYFYNRKDTLFRRSDPMTHFYVICSGQVKLFHETADGDDVTTDIRLAGDTICTTGVFALHASHHTHAAVIRDSTIMEFPVQWLRNAAREHNAVSLNLLSALSRHGHRQKTETENQAHMTPVQLLAAFLQQTCTTQGLNPHGFTLPFSKTLIASRLCMSRETLSRTLPKLKEMGISVTGTHVSLHDGALGMKH
jgi:CRP-like cAMP-binding protein